MSFPMINYKYNDLPEAPGLAPIVDMKFAAFEKYLADDTTVTCDVEFEKVTAQQQGKIFRVEANVLIGGKLYRAEATEESFEAAIDEVRDELDKELRRSKNKQETLQKQAGRDMKEQLLGAK